MARAHLNERSGEDAASLAARAMNGETLTPEQVKTLAGSVLSHRRLPVEPRGRLEGVSIFLPPRQGSGVESRPKALVHIRDNRTVELPLEGDLRDLAHWIQERSAR